jgi:hypothetical protein
MAGSMNTMSGRKLYICATAQANDLDQSAFAALTYVEIKGVGDLGEIGTKQNILTYDTWGSSVALKAKGLKDGGSPELEVARDTTDPGQDLLRIAAGLNLCYAFKIDCNDKITGGGANGIIYNRGYAAGPARPQGRNEDFDLEVFTLGFVQAEVVVDPT